MTNQEPRPRPDPDCEECLGDGGEHVDACGTIDCTCDGLSGGCTVAVACECNPLDDFDPLDAIEPGATFLDACGTLFAIGVRDSAEGVTGQVISKLQFEAL